MIDSQALLDMSYGMYIVATNNEGKNCGLVLDSLVQQNMNPPVISVSIHNESYTKDAIKASGKFTISVLDMNTRPELIATFGFVSSKDTQKFQNVEHKILESGMPVITENTCTYFECEVIKFEELDDHTVYFARLVNAQKMNNVEPMTYRYYYDVIRLGFEKGE